MSPLAQNTDSSNGADTGDKPSSTLIHAAKNNSRQAYIDPKTGKLTSQMPAEELNRLKSIEALQASEAEDDQIEVIDHSGGMQEIRLTGQMDSNYEVELDCSGNIIDKHTGHQHGDTTDCEQ